MRSREVLSGLNLARLSTALLALLLASRGGAAPAAGGIDSGTVEAFADHFFTTEMAKRHVPGAVFVVVEDGETVFERGYGYANLEEKRPITPGETLLRVGSVSKLFTATAVLQLLERGHLDLHEDVNTYLASFAIPATYPEPVTLEHLLTHSAGLDPRTIGAASRSPALPSLGHHLALRMPPRVRPPGVASSYSNYGMALAGHIVEAVAGIPFEQYVQEHILEPLEMDRSSFRPEPGLAGDPAIGYGFREPNEFWPVPAEYLKIPPAGQLTATATDMARFIMAHLQDGRFRATQILREDTARLMHRRQFTHHPRLPGWCYGFNEGHRNGQRVIGHAGGISGIWSYLVLIPEARVGFFVSQNGGGDFLAPALIESFMDAFFPDTSPPTATRAAAVEGPGMRLPSLAGRYRTTTCPRTSIARLQALLGVPEVEVRLDERGRLTVRNHAGGHIRLPPGPYEEIEPLLFREVEGDTHITFLEDERGRVTHLASDAHWDPVSYDRLSWYEHAPMHRRLLALLSLVYLSACVGWPVAALLRRWRRARATSPRDEGAGGAARARAWAGVTGALALAMLLALVLHLRVFPPALPYGELGAIPALLVLPLIAAALALVLVFLLARAWSRGYFSLPGRLHYTLVVAAVWALFPILWYWNLVGFHY